jgi:hypothetical protein
VASRRDQGRTPKGPAARNPAPIGQNLGDAEQERRMQTHDGLHLSVTTYGPEDAPLTVFLAHCWTLNKHGWHYQVRDLQQAFGHGPPWT